MIYIKENKEMKLKFKERIKGYRISDLNFMDRKLIELPNLKEKTLFKLSKYIKEKCITRACIDRDLMKNEMFTIFLYELNVKVFDGKWLFINLSEEIVDYILKNKNEDITCQEITILTNYLNKCLVSIIENLATKTKVLNIVTRNERIFKRIKEKLYEEKGIILNFYNNNPKSMLKSDIILNYDFSEEEISKYIIPKNGIIVNFKDDIKIRQKSFCGINAVDYMSCATEFSFDDECFDDFDFNVLCESFIYKNTLYENIKNDIKDNNITIKFLKNNIGEIKKNEYAKNVKKIANSLDKTEN